MHGWPGCWAGTHSSCNWGSACSSTAVGSRWCFLLHADALTCHSSAPRKRAAVCADRDVTPCAHCRATAHCVCVCFCARRQSHAGRVRRRVRVAARARVKQGRDSPLHADAGLRVSATDRHNAGLTTAMQGLLQDTVCGGSTSRRVQGLAAQHAYTSPWYRVPLLT